MAQSNTTRIPEGRRRAEERRRALSQQGKDRSTSQPPAAKAAPAAQEAVVSKSVSRSSGAAMVASGSGRDAALARRRAMSTQGKTGTSAPSRQRMRSSGGSKVASQGAPSRETRAAGCGCGGSKNESGAVASTGSEAQSKLAVSSTNSSRIKATQPRRSIGQGEGRQLSVARRRMLSERGKLTLEQNERVRSPAQRARQRNPDLSSRALAREVRSERSKNGNRGQKPSAPSGRRRPTAGGAEDAPWKVGASETASGQSVTGTQVGRSKRVTGDEASTCRVVTGTEYLAADIFKEFCQKEAVPNPRKVAVTKTAAGRTVTGTEVGRSEKVTGDEAGNCKLVTGNEYFPSEQVSAFCGTKPVPVPAKVSLTETARGRKVSGSNIDRPSKVTGTEAGADRQLTGTGYISHINAPVNQKPAVPKVGTSSTLRGGQVTGVVVGRSERVTGDEPGSCRHVTGDEYIGFDQYKTFCDTVATPEPPKVELSGTAKGQLITGTQTGRSGRVTGDEPGTCKTVTGTPYVGMETFQGYCEPNASRAAAARSRVGRATPAMPLTGIQPGIGGKMTGDRKGACENISGTPYVGQDQFSAACGGQAAVPGNPDFPQPLDGVPWTATFSVSSPARVAQRAQRQSGVTGTRYENGNITGPFVMGEGKITGTEQFRFGSSEASFEGMGAAPGMSAQSSAVDATDNPRSRVTGEGIDTGLKITGDDWGRNDRVTGTEGRSAARRNPTRRGPATAAMAMAQRNEPRPERQVEPAPSRVTGSSGNTDKGAFVTVSGGARG